MQNATDYRSLAAACRRAADMSKRRVPYLANLAEHYDRLAAQLDAQFSGDKPGAVGKRESAGKSPRR